MNFSSAFSYPFQNLAKVISIVLVLTIAFAVCIGLLLNSYDWALLFDQLYGFNAGQDLVGGMAPFSLSVVVGGLGVLLVAIASGFWLSGYSVEVIRVLMHDADVLPAVNLGRNIKDGFYLFLASVAYWLLFVGFLMIVVIINSVTGGLGVINALVALASIAATVVALCVLGWAYFVGMARFALMDDHKAAWEVRRNIKIARANWRSGALLLLFLTALTVIYGVVRAVVEGVFGGFAGMIGITVTIVIYYFFNLMQHFSTQHLIAQFAREIGLGYDYYNPEKDKQGAI